MNTSYLKKHSTVIYVVGIIVLIVAGLVARSFKKAAPDQSEDSSQPVVQLISTKDYSQNSHSVSANGTVESLQQADLRAQASGKITKLSVAIGQHVSQGQVLATVDQNGAAAAVTSARGSLEQAQANYQKLLAGASSEDVAVAQTALDSAKNNLTTTQSQQEIAVKNAYSTLLNSSLAATPAAGNQGTETVTITGTYTAQEQGVYNISLYATGSGLRFSYTGLEIGAGEVKSTPVPLGTKGLYIQFSVDPSVSNTWTVNIPNTFSSSYVSVKNAYQSALQAQTSAVAAAQNAVSAAQSALDLKRAQARPADMAAAQAQVTSAQGQLQSAQAMLENTVTRAPFAGTISAVPVKFADVVSPGQIVASIVNQGGLQIKVFVSGADLPAVHVGSKAIIGTNNIAGTVTNASPSVNATSKTGEVDIAVASPENSGLTVGQNVTVVIQGGNDTLAENVFLLPLQAVKITPDGHNYVYTIDSDSKARQTDVIIGTVDGEHVVVTKGLTSDMKIVSNAYDVSEGDKVQVQE